MSLNFCSILGYESDLVLQNCGNDVHYILISNWQCKLFSKVRILKTASLDPYVIRTYSYVSFRLFEINPINLGNVSS